MSARFSHPTKRQCGSISAITVLLIAFVVSLALLSSLEIADTGLADTMNQSDGVAALFLAESGLEYAMYQLANGSACGALATTQNLGKGAFTNSAGFTTNFDGVTALPAGQCRLQTTGTTGSSALGSTARTVQAIVNVSAGGGIAFDGAASIFGNNRDNVTWTHTTGGGVDRMLIVGVVFDNTGGIIIAPGNITYNGMAMIRLQSINNANLTFEQWYLLNPLSGAFIVSVTLSAKTSVVAGSVSLSGADQAVPELTLTQTGTSSVALRTITPLTNNAWIVDVVGRHTDSALTASGGGTQTSRWNDATGGAPATRIRAAASTAGPVSNVAITNMQWTLADAASNWGIIATAVAPSGGTSQILAWREIVQ